MLRQIPSSTLRRADRLAVTGAWFFLAISLGLLAWVIAVKVPSPRTHLVLYDAWGLSYDGFTGLLLAAAQLGVVAVATVATLPRRRSRARRLGHAVLVGWAALWTLGLLGVASDDGSLGSAASAGFMGVLCACTVYRAVRPRRAVATASAPPAPDDQPHAPPAGAARAAWIESTSERARRAWAHAKRGAVAARPHAVRAARAVGSAAHRAGQRLSAAARAAARPPA